MFTCAEKKTIRSFSVGFFLCVAFVWGGCAPNYTRPDQLSNMPEPELSLTEWCAKGVTAMCIDHHFEQLRRGGEDEHRAALVSYCEQGHGSACLYASSFAGRAYRARACELGEVRACYKESLALGSNAGGVCSSPGTSAPPAGETQEYKEVIREVIREARPPVAYCYTRLLVGSPEPVAELLSGRLIATFAIQPKHGEVGDVGAHCSTLRSDEMKRCVLQVVDSLQFPYPDVPGRRAHINVTYPFNFSI